MLGGFGIFDIVVIALVVICLIIGVVRGMRKILFGLVASLAAIAIAVLLTGIVTDAVVVNTTWDDSLVTTIAQPIAAKMPYGSQTLVYADTDGDPATADALGFYEGSTWHPFSDILGENKIVQYASGFIENTVRKQYPDDTAQLSFVLILSKMLVALALSVVAFVILWIALAIVFALLNKMVKKFVTGTYIGHFLNKVLGGVLGVVVAWAILMIVLTVVQILSPLSFMAPVNEAISSSFTGPYLIQYNFLYQLVGSSVDISSLAAKIGG